MTDSLSIAVPINKIRENGFELTKKKSRRDLTKTITDADHADDIALLANTPNQAETLLHSLEWASAGISLHVNAHKTEYMCFNQAGDISTLDGNSETGWQIHLPRKQCLINWKRHQHTANEGMDSYWYMINNQWFFNLIVHDNYFMFNPIIQMNVFAFCHSIKQKYVIKNNRRDFRKIWWYHKKNFVFKYKNNNKKILTGWSTWKRNCKELRKDQKQRYILNPKEQQKKLKIRRYQSRIGSMDSGSKSRYEWLGEKSSLVCHLHNFSKNIWSSQIMPYIIKILQNFWLTFINYFTHPFQKCGGRYLCFQL